MHWLLFYEGADDFVNRRAPFRPAHLEYLQAALDRGMLQHGGAIGDPPNGSVMTLIADSAAEIEEFARNDPYVVNGAVVSWRVERWYVVLGEGAEPL